MNIMYQEQGTEEIRNVTSLPSLNVCFLSVLDKEEQE